MLVLITYDVNTETAAGKARLRKVAKQCVNYGRRLHNISQTGENRSRFTSSQESFLFPAPPLHASVRKSD